MCDGGFPNSAKTMWVVGKSKNRIRATCRKHEPLVTRLPLLLLRKGWTDQPVTLRKSYFLGIHCKPGNRLHTRRSRPQAFCFWRSLVVSFLAMAQPLIPWSASAMTSFTTHCPTESKLPDLKLQHHRRGVQHQDVWWKRSSPLRTCQNREPNPKNTGLPVEASL